MKSKVSQRIFVGIEHTWNEMPGAVFVCVGAKIDPALLNWNSSIRCATHVGVNATAYLATKLVYEFI